MRRQNNRQIWRNISFQKEDKIFIKEKISAGKADTKKEEKKTAKYIMDTSMEKIIPKLKSVS